MTVSKPETVGVTQADRDLLERLALALSDKEKLFYIARHRLNATPSRQDGLREALALAATRLEICAQMIAGSFSASGTLRAERVIKAKHFAQEALAALSNTPPPDNEETEAVKKILADGLNNAAASAPGWRIKILSEAMHKALSVFNNGGK